MSSVFDPINKFFKGRKNSVTSETPEISGSYPRTDFPSSPMVEDIEGFPRINTGVKSTQQPSAKEESDHNSDGVKQTESEDPFASQRGTDPVAITKKAQSNLTPPASPGSPTWDRRQSTDEWGEFLESQKLICVETDAGH